MCSRKLGHKCSGGQIVKSHKISVLYNALLLVRFKQLNHLSRPNGSQALILCKSLFNFIIPDYLTLDGPCRMTRLFTVCKLK